MKTGGNYDPTFILRVAEADGLDAETALTGITAMATQLPGITPITVGNREKRGSFPK